MWTQHPEELYESNVEGTRRLIAAAERAGVERIVYTSTVATIAVPRHGAALPNEATAARLVGEKTDNVTLMRSRANRKRAAASPPGRSERRRT